MPKFAITYHLMGTDHAPQEQIDADDIHQAAEKVGNRFSSEDKSGAVVVPFDQDMYAIPKHSVAYCHIRQIVERRRAASTYSWEDETQAEGTETAAA